MFEPQYFRQKLFIRKHKVRDNMLSEDKFYLIYIQNIFKFLKIEQSKTIETK